MGPPHVVQGGGEPRAEKGEARLSAGGRGGAARQGQRDGERLGPLAAAAAAAIIPCLTAPAAAATATVGAPQAQALEKVLQLSALDAALAAPRPPYLKPQVPIFFVVGVIDGEGAGGQQVVGRRRRRRLLRCVWGGECC